METKKSVSDQIVRQIELFRAREGCDPDEILIGTRVYIRLADELAGAMSMPAPSRLEAIERRFNGVRLVLDETEPEELLARFTPSAD